MEASEVALIVDTIDLAKLVSTTADMAQSFLHQWLDVVKRVNRLSLMLETLRGFIATSTKKSLYLRPVDVILGEVQRSLKHALAIASNCNLKNVFCWLFTFTTEPPDFQTLFRNLNDSSGNMKWLLEVYDPKNNGTFGGIIVFLPPILINNPFLLLVWHCIATVQMGRHLNDRIDAVNSLASLAEDNDMYKRYIVEERGVPVLLKLLEESNFFDVQIAAINALCIIANVEEIMQIIAIAIVGLLYNAPIEGKIEAANLVAKLAEENPGMEFDSTKGNVIWPLVTLLSSETSKLELKISCAEALWMLARGNVSNCRAIAETKAMLCLANLVQQKQGRLLKYYCLMTIMEIAAAAEFDIGFRCATFKTNSPSAKAVVDQLLRVIKESRNPGFQIPAIKSVGSLARIFLARESTRVIGALVSLLDNRHLTVASESAIALEKFTCEENFLHEEHLKSMNELNALMRLKRGGNEMMIQLPRFARPSYFVEPWLVNSQPLSLVIYYYVLHTLMAIVAFYFLWLCLCSHRQLKRRELRILLASSKGRCGVLML
ncbi:Armadillo [Corchorus olitorius]|uniref:Armadillo n=1 Tax=Corchorus olitorius TaxID=93759 RepID=A0A1R3JBL5_9ROSI|nr:Armadillo [Corchorus olitorius]